MNRLILAAVMTLAASAALAAPAPAADAPKTEAAATEGKEKLICVRERTMGSNRVKRICRTPEQMATDSEDTRDALIRAETATPTPGSGL